MSSQNITTGIEVLDSYTVSSTVDESANTSTGNSSGDNVAADATTTVADTTTTVAQPAVVADPASVATVADTSGACIASACLEWGGYDNDCCVWEGTGSCKSGYTYSV